MRSGSSGSSGKSSNAWQTAAAAPLSNYEFDFGNLGGSGRSTSIGSTTTTTTTRGTTNSTLKDLKSHLPSQPSNSTSQSRWVHQPAASLSGTTSMVGDITGRSWVPLDSFSKPSNASTSTSSRVGTSSGVVGGVGSSKVDLFSDLLKGPMSRSSNTPISMTSVASALPVNKGGGTSMRSMNEQKRQVHVNSNAESDDLFGDFSSAPSNGFHSTAQAPPPVQEVKKPQDPFADLWSKITPPQSSSASSVHVKPPPSTSSSSIPVKPPVSQGGVSSKPDESSWMGGLDDWDVGTGGTDEFSSSATTTELDGLPPPPAGVTGSLARDKGVEFQKQGQFADAIKWLTWSVMLLEKASESSMLEGVLSCRVLCYKEVGEYKKAVDDCCKVLEMNGGDTEILLQRAFLYESMEKYKLSVQDLREALKRDPTHRLARNTLARLAKMVD